MRLPWLDAIDGLDVRTPPSPHAIWLETLILTVVAVGLSIASNSADPLRVQGGFPWPLIGPLLAGLRYGFAAGFASALLVLATLGVMVNRGWQPVNEFPLAWATGVVVVAMVCGEFRDAWQRRLIKLAGANQYRGERLEEFTRSYHLLRVSHDRLEQALAGSGLSLREALTRLTAVLQNNATLTSASAQKVLELASSYGALQQAAIYPVDGNGRWQSDALAQWGQMPTLQQTDPLLSHALQRAELVAVQTESASLERVQQSPLLAAVPLVDSTGRVHAVLAIAAMPFFAFHQATLTVLAVLCAHAADALSGAGAPGSEQNFARQIARALADAERFRLPATLVTVDIRQTGAESWLSVARRERRALDLWRERGNELVILMPLTTAEDAQGWQQRLQAALPQDAASPTLRIALLDSGTAAQALLAGRESP